MFCSFDRTPMILRLYGKGRTILPNDPEWPEIISNFNIYPGTRQIIAATITKVQTSCGFGVPLYEYLGERNMHAAWAERKGKAGLKEYINNNNLKSLDGLSTPIATRAHGIS